MKCRVPTLAWFGQKYLDLDFPDDWKTILLPMNGYAKPMVAGDAVKKALKEPYHTKPLVKLAEGKREVAIVVDDMTRPTKAYQILPYILGELKAAGISDDHIRFIMGGGLHGAWYRYDFAKKIGEENVERYPVYNHNPFSNCERVGETGWGTPVEVNAEYNSCDLKIGIGAVLPHPMTGYGGGAKIILPGVSSFNTVYHNHVTVHKKNPPLDSLWGFVKGNVTRADIDEAGRIAGMNMKVDVLVNGVGDCAGIYAGDLQEAFVQAVAEARNHYSTPDFPSDVDVIVANTYAKANEAALALSSWRHRLKEDGVMVLIAQAPEGQTTHYLVGKFGKRQYGPGGSLTPDVGFKKLIVYSEYKTPDPLLPIAESKVVWVKTWKEVLEEVKSSFTHKPKVAVLPNAEIQCDEKFLNRE
ncbi:MAG: lactate racemase domain-containing protein [Candidatus Bathyarchaeia archaeon]